MNIGRFSLFTAIVFGSILFMGTGETSADSVPESEVDFAAQMKACYVPWVNDDADGNDCNKGRYSDYDSDTEFVYSNFVNGYNIYFEGNVSDDDGNVIEFEWKFENLEWSSTETGLVTYVYNQDGVYHTEFRVTNSAGYTALDDRIVTVSSEEAIQQIDEETDSGFLPSLSVTSVIFLLGLISLIRNKRK